MWTAASAIGQQTYEPYDVRTLVPT
ncbi:MAG: hypothetical protein QOE34_69, partial [Verrucomicrobiota bacterium]